MYMPLTGVFQKYILYIVLPRCYYQKRQLITSVGTDVKSEPSHTSGGNVNGAAALKNSLGVPQKIK